MSDFKAFLVRFSQFQALYKSLSQVHKQLYLHGQFPEALETSYFNRKEPEVIERRKVWSLDLLEFIASQPILNTHTTFTNFLFDLQELEAGDGTDQAPLGGVHEDGEQPGQAPEDGPKAAWTGVGGEQPGPAPNQSGQPGWQYAAGRRPEQQAGRLT